MLQRLLLLLALTVAAQAIPPPPWQLKTLSQGKSYVVNAFHNPPGQPDRTRTLIWHTRLDTGLTKVLALTGTEAISTRRASFVQSRILGLLVQEERLYLLIWSSGTVFDHPPGETTPYAGGTWTVFALRLRDGEELGSQAVKAAPSHAPPETLEPGPLKPIPGGVECYGQSFSFPAQPPASPAR